MPNSHVLIRVIRRLFDPNKLQYLNREDTIGVMMRCGAFHEIPDEVELVNLCAEIDNALLTQPKCDPTCPH